MKFSILIPTYHNPHKLARCIDSLEKQSHLPDEVVVLYEKGDEDSLRMLQDFTGNLNLIALQLKNMEHMSCTLNAGISKAEGEIIAFLDEDVAPEREWVEKLSAEFEDKEVVACGGKDTIFVKGRKVFRDSVDDVGMIKWKGYIVGDQHRGRKRRDVAFLKGCNMAVRKVFLAALDENLMGLVRWEQDIFFHLQSLDMRILYDPSIEVYHQKDALTFLSPRRTFSYGHNTLYLLLKYLKGMDKILALLFILTIGDVSSPGFIQLPFWLIKRNETGICSFATAQIGKIKAIFTHLDKYCRKGKH